MICENAANMTMDQVYFKVPIQMLFQNLASLRIVYYVQQTVSIDLTIECDMCRYLGLV